MAGIELATAYVSIVPSTKNLDSLLQKAFKDAGRSAQITPTVNTKGMAQAGANASQSFHRSFQANASSQAQRVGQNVGTILGKGISVGVAGAVGAIGYTLTKGFQRLERIDNAAFKLKALGNSAADVDKIMKSATDAVKGTAFALDDAATAAASAVAAGVKPGEQLTKYLSNIGDAAAVAGTSFDDMARIFNKVQANGKAYTDDLNMLQDRGVPVMKLLQDQYGVTADELRKMVEDGKVSAADFEAALSGKIGGAAQKMGQSFSGAVDNAQTAVARLGANFLASIFGGSSTNALAGPAEAVTALTEKLDMANAWVTSNGPQIRAFFTDIKNVVSDVAGAIKGIIGFLDGMGVSAADVVIAFAAWKTISGVASLATSLTAISNMLRLTLPASAAAGATGISAALSRIVWPAALGALVLPAAGAAGQTLADTPGGMPELRNPTDNAAALSTRPKDSIYGGPGAQRDRKGAGYTGDFFGQSATGVGAPSGSGATTSVAPASYSPPAGSGAEGWRPLVKSTIAQYGAQFGITNSKAWEDAIVRQISSESGGNPNAVNDWDSNAAAGIPSKGLLQFIEPTFNSHNVTGGKWLDPKAQIAAVLSYVTKRYGIADDGGPNRIGRGNNYATGGGVNGPGGVDKVPAWLTRGEHVLTTEDVSAMGGQSGVYAFRSMLAGGFKRGGAVLGKDEYVLTPERIAELEKRDAQKGNTPHGAAQGAPPGPSPEELEKLEQPEINDAGRQEGYIPAGAGFSGKTGGGLAGSFIGMGAEAVKGLIDSAASGASMGADMFAPGSGMAIQMGAAIAKRGVDYAAELGSIGIGALSEIFMPFGAPRWLSDVDATSFIPQQSMTPALTTTSEQAVDDIQNQHGMNPGAPGPIPPEGPQPPGGLDVLSRATQDAADTLAPPPSPPMVNVENITAADSNAVGESIAKGQRLAMMRFAGRP